MAKRRMGIISFLLCLFICLLPCQVRAVSTADAKEPINIDADCSLTLSYQCNGTAFSNLPIKLYKVADVSSEYQYSLTSPFSSTGLILNGIQTAGEWNAIRSTLETHIVANKIEPDFTFTTDNDGLAFFETLKPGLYLVTTERVFKYGISYIFHSSLIALPNLDANGIWEYDVTVSPKSKIIPPSIPDETIQLKVIKLWKGDNENTDRPKSVEVEIFCNGTSYQIATLSKENNWTFTWSATDDGSIWKVVERKVPDGYNMTVEERQNSFVLTNTFVGKGPDAPSTPDTGDTSNIMLYVILMIVSGTILIVLAFTGKRKNND